jgi:hypothetical protein
MPYNISGKGDQIGCSGYAVTSDTGKVVGCHATRAEAESQVQALYANVEDATKGSSFSMDPRYPNIGVKAPQKVKKQMITEGDFVMAMTTEGVVVGQVEHVMREGGTYGEPGNPYSVESTPENPAVAIRMLEEDDGVYYYTPYSIGALMSDVKLIDRPNISLEMEDEEEDEEDVDKVEGGGIDNLNPATEEDKTIKKPRRRRRGSSPDALDNGGMLGVGPGGTSLGGI